MVLEIPVSDDATVTVTVPEGVSGHAEQASTNAEAI
jgi:hypothetical protein